MKRVIITFSFFWLMLPFYTNAQQTNDFPKLKGLYFGQKPPGLTPEVFAPEILSKSKPEWAFCSVFSPDGNEFYFTSELNENPSDIMWMRKVNNIWTQPETAPFNSPNVDNDLCLSYDENRVFWRSWRPLPGNSEPEEHSKIWYAVRTTNGWGDPQPLKCGNTVVRAGYPSISNNRTLYFSYGDEHNTGIFQSRFVNDAYRTPEHVCTVNDTIDSEGDMCIAPDESYMIVSCWRLPENNGDSDLYISFRKNDGSWTKFKNMGKSVNTINNEGCPTVSPDGKYLFYLSVGVEGEVVKCDTYWVDSKVIELFKPDELK